MSQKKKRIAQAFRRYALETIRYAVRSGTNETIDDDRYWLQRLTLVSRPRADTERWPFARRGVVEIRSRAALRYSRLSPSPDIHCIQVLSTGVITPAELRVFGTKARAKRSRVERGRYGNLARESSGKSSKLRKERVVRTMHRPNTGASCTARNSDREKFTRRLSGE